jgi:hypothetical protein
VRCFSEIDIPGTGSFDFSFSSIKIASGISNSYCRPD